MNLTDASREQVWHYLNTACPKHGMPDRHESCDPNGDPTGDYYCGARGCDWEALVGHGYDGDVS